MAEIEPDWLSPPPSSPYMPDQAPPLSASTNNATVMYATSARPVESGHILRLKVKTADLKKTKTLIEAQWVALKLAVLCGAADVADKLNRDPPPLPLKEMAAMVRNLPKLPARAESEVGPEEIQDTSPLTPGEGED